MLNSPRQEISVFQQVYVLIHECKGNSDDEISIFDPQRASTLIHELNFQFLCAALLHEVLHVSPGKIKLFLPFNADDFLSLLI